jgi:hypothetical protein
MSEGGVTKLILRIPATLKISLKGGKANLELKTPRKKRLSSISTVYSHTMPCG